MNARNEREAHALLRQSVGDEFPEPRMDPHQHDGEDQSQGLSPKEAIAFWGVVLLCFAVAVALGSCVIGAIVRSAP